MSITRLANARSLSSSSISSALGRGYIYDADAETYIAAVEAADGQRLEWGVRQAISQFVAGCKTDGIWTPIKASCILAGARTLSGALTPLVGPTPTNNGPFVSGDYDRKTGLVGNGSTKYIDTGRGGNADGQNDAHAAVWVSSWSTAQSGYRAFIGSGDAQTGANNLFWQTSPPQSGTRLRMATADVGNISGTLVAGVLAINRSASGSYTVRANGTTATLTRTSETPTAFNWWVFTTNSNGSVANPTSSRLMFYSVGASIDLALLSARLSTLTGNIAAAIA